MRYHLSMSFNFFKLFPRNNNDDDECGCQSKWLSIALVVLPAVLPVLVEKIADFLMRYFFGEEKEVTTEEEETEETES
jgi:hypothetical protein